MGIGDTGLPEQRAVRAGVVSPTGRHANNVLPMGMRGPVGYSQERRRGTFWDCICGTASAAATAKRFGTYRNTQCWKRQHRPVPGSGAGITAGIGGVAADMLNDFTGADKVYIACGYTDLWRGIDGLTSIVQQQFQLDPFTDTLFLFCGRRKDRIKGLCWEKGGFILLYKRLEQGVYQRPRSESEVRALTPQQYRWLMGGPKIEQPKAHKEVTGLSCVV